MLQKIQNKFKADSESFIIFSVILLIAQSQVTEAIYTSSIPNLISYFQTTPTMVDYTLVTSFVSFVVGMITCGVLSDVLGKNGYNIWYCNVYCIKFIMCAQ